MNRPPATDARPVTGRVTGPATDANTEWPAVTVIVLNYNGKHHLQTCLTSLLQLDYPAHRLELLFVDNASADDSVAYVCAHFPQVRVLETGENLGFAAGNNAGAAVATGDYIAFLNNDTRVEPDWLRALMQPCLDHADVVCTGATMLDWEGRRLDFGTGWMNFHGFAFQKDQGWSLPAMTRSRDGDGNTPAPTLFACGGAMLVRRDLFVETGGFDADHFAFYEDVDLGWRLWLMGYRVLSVPQAITYHRLHATTGTLTPFRKWVLFERNALMTVIKNYDDANLATVLPGALMLLIARCIRLLRVDGWQAADYDIRAPRTADDPELTEAVSRSGLAVLVAANEVVENLPRLLEKRRALQARRRRPDAEIFARFGQPLYAHTMNIPATDIPYTRTHYAVVKALGIGELFAATGRRILLVTSEAQRSPDVARAPDQARSLSPAHASPTGVGKLTEAAARPWRIGQALTALGHEVLYAMPRAAVNARPDATPRAYELAWEPGRVHAVVHKCLPDVIVVCGVAALANLEGVSTPLALDLAELDLTELDLTEPLPSEMTSQVAELFSGVDFVTCDTPARRAAVLPSLQPAGMADVVAFALGDATGEADADAIAPLDAFCRMPYKRSPAQVESPAGGRAGSAQARVGESVTAQRAPGKGLGQLAREAYAHYRQGGVRGLLYELLGFLQRRLAE
ncbi:MAG: glycosyltransferase family 2 protein [Litorilinea sp.]